MIKALVMFFCSSSHKKYNLAGFLRCFALIGLISLCVILSYKTYIRYKEMNVFQMQAKKEVLYLLDQYYSVVKLVESLGEKGDLSFYNKILQKKDTFPAVSQLSFLLDLDGKCVNNIFVANQELEFTIPAKEGCVKILVKVQEIVNFALKKIKAAPWFDITINNTRNLVIYSGHGVGMFLLDSISNYKWILSFIIILIVSATILDRWDSKLFRLMNLEQLHKSKLKKLRIRTKQTIESIQRFRFHSDSARRLMYVLFNKAIANDSTSFDKEEMVNMMEIIAEAKILLEPMCSEKDVLLVVKSVSHFLVTTRSREILLIVVLNYIYRAIIRSTKKSVVEIYCLTDKADTMTLKIKDKGYFFLENNIDTLTDIFCLSGEALSLLTKKLNIEVIFSSNKINYTDIKIFSLQNIDQKNKNVIQFKK